MRVSWSCSLFVTFGVHQESPAQAKKLERAPSETNTDQVLLQRRMKRRSRLGDVASHPSRNSGAQDGAPSFVLS